jgi:hypothetical protein
VRESTSPDPNDNRSWRSGTWFSDWPEWGGYYKYQWWGKHKPNGGYDFMAIGHGGQRIYVSPSANAIVVRHGISEGGVDHWEDVIASVIQKVN